MSDYKIETLSFSMGDPQFESFKKRVDELNQKYSYWLEQHYHVVDVAAPIDLHNYFSIHTHLGKVTFNVFHMEGFPSEIQEDLTISFKQSYR